MTTEHKKQTVFDREIYDSSPILVQWIIFRAHACLVPCPWTIQWQTGDSWHTTPWTSHNHLFRILLNSYRSSSPISCLVHHNISIYTDASLALSIHACIALNNTMTLNVSITRGHPIVLMVNKINIHYTNTQASSHSNVPNNILGLKHYRVFFLPIWRGLSWHQIFSSVQSVFNISYWSHSQFLLPHSKLVKQDV